VISLEMVTKSYPASTRPALDDVSMEIEKGEFVFLIGPSGSGKSTCLRLILKEDSPTQGTVIVNGKTLNTMSGRQVPKLRRTMGCVFQDFRLLRNKTVSENVAFALEVINKPKRTINKVVPEVLEMVGLDGKAERMPHELSGGEQQRVALARAVVTRPAIVLADEPTGNLDSENSALVLNMFQELNYRFNQTIVMITHNPEAAAMCRRIVQMRDGHIVEPAPSVQM